MMTTINTKLNITPAPGVLGPLLAQRANSTPLAMHFSEYAYIYGDLVHM